jgi:hypothetical protein
MAAVRALPIETSAEIGRPVHAMEIEQQPAFVENRDRHVPFVLLRFRLAGTDGFCGVGGCQAGLVTHLVTHAGRFPLVSLG